VEKLKHALEISKAQPLDPGGRPFFHGIWSANRGGSEHLQQLKEAKIAALREELDCINRANVVFWEQGLSPNREARAEYRQRQDRIQEIMKELANLVSGRQWAS
jgi:hypothetical protein